MNKIAVLLLTILIALSFMGCATTQNSGTQDRDQWYMEQTLDKIKPPDYLMQP
jgi:PBP1b-binding outer membrane lipoprotein LpoB